VSTDEQFSLGDRVSFVGGEGIVVKTEGELIHILTDDKGKIVKHRSDLPLVTRESSFESGEQVTFPGGRGEIIKIEERAGKADLLFINPEEGEMKTLPADQKGLEPLDGIDDQIASGRFSDPQRFRLLTRATELNLAHRFDRFLSLTGNRIDVAPHQVEAVHEILTSHDHRYLIADEVGLGKTIEAGLVIEELIARDRADRVLIVTPASLTAQWQAEMEEKFDQDYRICDRQFFDSHTRGDRNPWEQHDRIITSIDFAKQDSDGNNETPRQLLEEAHWDVAVVDESHHLTARRSSDGTLSKTQRYRVGEVVSEQSDALLFLTGTPHKGKHDQFYFMIDLLEPYRFENEDDISPAKLNDLMIRRLKSNDNMVHPDGSPMFPEKHIETIPVEFTDAEDQLYQEVTNYLRNYYRKGEQQASHAAGFSMVIFQKRLVSSIRAIERSLQKRKQALERGADGELSQTVRSLLPRYRNRPETLTDEQRQRVEDELQQAGGDQDPEDARKELEVLDALLDRISSIDVDSKARRLGEFVDGILAEDPEEKVLVFTEYTDTLEYLRDEVFAEQNVAQIHGGMSQVDRREAVEFFREEANVMLATDAAREGINLQFAHIMVNYDLPWNPIRIDQRMGRLHRYGQDQEVGIYNLFVQDTRESQILEQLITKIDRIESDLGMRSDVLGMVLENNDFSLEDRIMEAVSTGESPDQVVRDIDEIVEERKQAVKKIQENFLISDQFGESELEEVQELIRESREEHVGQEEVRELVETFFTEHDGEIDKRQREDFDDPVFRFTVPSVLDLRWDEVHDSYHRVTFSQEVAREDQDVEFLGVNHPLVQAIIEYCLEEDLMDARTTVMETTDPDADPGLRCNFRIGYETADGSEEIEELVPIWVPVNGAASEAPPARTDPLDPEGATDRESVQKVMLAADELVGRAEDVAQSQAETMAEKAGEGKAEEVAIKREHAERYFENAIDTWETRLEEYRRKQQRGDDMTMPIRRAKSELQDLREQRKREFEQLSEEEATMPKKPDLVNAAVIIPAE
jgi:superfamily II DNA/RNA helicase